jgi:hypothetical protein
LTPERSQELHRRRWGEGKRNPNKVSGTRARRKTLEDAVWWAATVKEGAQTNSPLKRVLLQLRKSDPVAFLKQFLLAGLPQPPKEAALPPEKAVESEAEVLGATMEHLRAFLKGAEGRVVQPSAEAELTPGPTAEGQQ